MFLTLALAAPPIPAWTYADPVRVDDADAEALPEEEPAAARERTTTTVAFQRPPPRRFAWADEAALTVDLSEDVGRFDYLMITARGTEGLVAHWRQGPYAGEDATRTFALEWPTELLGLMSTHGPLRLTVDVVVVDAHDAPIGRDRLGVTWATWTNGTPVGAVMVESEVTP